MLEFLKIAQKYIDLVHISSGLIVDPRYGGAGSSGLECGLALALEGKEVTVVDMIPLEEFGKEMFRNTQFMTIDLLNKHKATLIGSQKVEKKMPNGVDIIDRNLVRTIIEADLSKESYM
ncbi:hypothetical protein LPY66_11420 [Dehalobacter sp. DCM]|uniref:hypothetical protein n=1 Tax=Dehalobacter sp. DCM TaxID=2907827 RepID=UPI0030812BEB|nr:hypothetical protein LPY66_11420 [Dehalobacter sp. DCM]